MAEKLDQNPSLKEIYEALKNTKCLKSLLESSDNFTELIFLQNVTEHCENLDKKLEVYEQQKCKYERINIPSRDEILYSLNLFWEIFCCAELKQQNCSSFLKLFKILCEENSLLKVLFKCLNCDDHFIAFQSYKALCKVYNCFPNLVVCVRFKGLINLSLSAESENCSLWLPVYTAKIITGLFIQIERGPNVLNLNENRSKIQKDVCRCIVDEERSDEICAKEIMSVLCHHWLKLTNHFLARLSTVLKSESLLARDVCGFRFDSFQQILTTMLSCVKTFIQSCDCLLANQKSPVMSTCEKGIQRTFENGKLTAHCENMDFPIETLKNAKRARISENGNLCDSKLDHSCQMCKNAIFNDDSIRKSFYGDEVSSTHDCELKLFEQIIIQLIEIDHKRCLLHFSRTVFQFLNDVVSSVSEHYFGQEKTTFWQNQVLRSTRICSILVENSNRLLGDIPHVLGKVHFGGQDRGCKEETYDVCGPSHDEVSLRKVLLLVVKLMLVTLHGQNELSKITWQALKEPLESLLNFVTQTPHAVSPSTAVWLVQLFSEQDDELICFLFCLLQLYQELFCSKSLQPIPSWATHLGNSLNPHCFFMEFLTSINYDHSLLLDFLISNETHFLPYFHNYLRHLANDWHGFIETVERRQVLSNEESLKLSGAVQAPKGNGSGFSCCSTQQFCRTVKSCSGDGDGADDDGCDDDGDSGSNGGDVDGDNCDGADDDGGGDNDYDGVCDDDGNGGDNCDGDDDDGGGDNGNGNDYDGISDDGVCDDSVCDDDGDNRGGDGGGDDDCDRHFSDGDGSGVSYGDLGHGEDGGGGGVLCKMKNLKKALTCLIRLRFSIERMESKGLFPYPVTALVKVMKYIETLYEEEE